MRRALALAACAAVLGLCGCGGGSDTASTTSSTTPELAGAPQPSHPSTAAPREAKSRQAKTKAKSSNAKDEGSEEQSGGSEEKAPRLVRVPPISSAAVAGSKAPAPGVKTVKGADNTVQEYGVEADESAREEAAIALQAYLNARLREDWAGACSFLAQRPKEQLEKLERSAARRQGTNLDGCAGTMAVLGKGTPRSQLQEEATITEVLSLRGEGDVSGDPSYLIFTGPPAKTLYSMPMYLEGSAWKVGLAQPAELPVR